MNARYYVPYINRFASADTIVPNAKNPQSFNRYSYSYNNPVKYRDPSGHLACNSSSLPEDDNFCPPPTPNIVSRQDWGAREPGNMRFCVQRAGCFNVPDAEGLYDPNTNQAGYANYADLLPGQELPDIYNQIVIHHEGNSQTYDPVQVKKKHMMNNGWHDIGYHFIIGPDGTIYEGRDINVRGAHVEGGNTGKVGVLLLGDFEPGREFWIFTLPDRDDHPTNSQLNSTIKLIRWLDYNYGIDSVVGHGDLNVTECPGAYCINFMPTFNDAAQDY